MEVFDAEMQHQAARRLDLESALRQATVRGELLTHYQPIVDLGSGQVSHLEALVRWDRPGIGLIPPDDFIPVAEDAGIIVEIGAWVLRQATADCRALAGGRPGRRHLGERLRAAVRLGRPRPHGEQRARPRAASIRPSSPSRSPNR